LRRDRIMAMNLFRMVFRPVGAKAEIRAEIWVIWQAPLPRHGMTARRA
jgi:hypothetical protein